MNYLLSDEKQICDDDYKEREKLCSEFKKMPIEFFSKLRHFQPQIGCLNACSICSKYASTNVSCWNISRIRNIIAALKYSSPHKDKPLIVWDRDNHRTGVIFSYLDNDVGIYQHLFDFIKLAYEELGVVTRISTVGFSHYNTLLNDVHRKISNNFQYLGGVRLSFTPYEIGWVCNGKSDKFSREEYKNDITNFLEIYKTYFEKVGSGARKFCVEIRFKPLIKITDVQIKNDNDDYFIIKVDGDTYISKNKNIKFEDTFIKDPTVHRLSLTNNGIDFVKYDKNNIKTNVKIYRVKNRDGYYYCVNPKLTDDGCYGLNIYPKTSTRKQSGYLILERFFLNEMFLYQKNIGGFKNVQYEYCWDDVENVINNLKIRANGYKKQGDFLRFEYIYKEILPMISIYAESLKNAGYSANCFFDKNFTIDTGIICNLGRALHCFKGLVSFENEPLTLNHERNYGIYNSTMTTESVAWRLSCQYNDKIVIEKLNLANTSTNEGQEVSKKEIQLNISDEELNQKNLLIRPIIPGQNKIDDTIRFYKEYGENGYLATYSNYGFEKDGIYYKTSEHYYQSKKFDDPNVVKKIINAETPKEASIIGRSRKYKIRKNWKEIKNKVMHDAVLYKFLANEDIRKKLLATGNSKIVEETTKENYWGIGPKFDGENIYGRILCEVRKELEEEKWENIM